MRRTGADPLIHAMKKMLSLWRPPGQRPLPAPSGCFTPPAGPGGVEGAGAPRCQQASFVLLPIGDEHGDLDGGLSVAGRLV